MLGLVMYGVAVLGQFSADPSNGHCANQFIMSINKGAMSVFQAFPLTAWFSCA